jgi:phospho-N-acetylmuramoyl-pentapeptide-transferase
MLYNLLEPYVQSWNLANLFHYITFRSGLATLFSLIICFLIGPVLIRKLKELQKYGQPIRQDGPETHQSKAGTPTMGGIMIIASVTISTLCLANLANPYIWIVLFVFISFSILGFLDDYAKISKNNHKGVSGKQKIIVQFLVSLIACLATCYLSEHSYATKVSIPFAKRLFIDLGIFYLVFAIFVVIGSSNAVNLTDGLDGLAIVPIAIAAASFGLIAYLVGNSLYANYLQITYIPEVGELTIFTSAIVGAGLGFLWFNAQPAEVFMGDTGSLSLGGVLGIIAVITKHEIVLGLVGGLFVIETLSVIIQVYYYKKTGGKRIFKMAPLHHHFEKCGWPESKVVIRFWILAIIFALIGLSSLKLR